MLCRLKQAVPVVIAFILLKAHFIYIYNYKAMELQGIFKTICVLGRNCGTSCTEPEWYCVFNRAEENITTFNSVIQTQCSSPAEIMISLQVCSINWQTQDSVYKKRLVPSFPIYICCCLFICLVCWHLFEDKLCQAPKV